jgi:hypothetical protein
MRQLFVLAFAGCALSAQAILFDWENTGLGTFPSVSQTVSGVTATATGGAQGVTVQDESSFPGWGPAGVRTPISAAPNPRDPFRVDFSTNLLTVAAITGDLGADDDGSITLTGYNSANVVVAFTSVPYGGLSVPVAIAIAGPNIRYVIGTGGGAFPNSIFWDNFEVTAVPEPSVLLALGLGIAAIARKRLRK